MPIRSHQIESVVSQKSAQPLANGIRLSALINFWQAVLAKEPFKDSHSVLSARVAALLTADEVATHAVGDGERVQSKTISEHELAHVVGHTQMVLTTR